MFAPSDGLLVTYIVFFPMGSFVRRVKDDHPSVLFIEGCVIRYDFPNSTLCKTEYSQLQ